MLDRILPERLDNHFRGHRVALWIFVAITVFQVALGLGHIANPDGGAQSAANIPLDTYPADAAQNVIAVLARLGAAQLMLGLVFVIVLARYRSMIPLMYVMVVLGYLGMFAVAWFKPLASAVPAGSRLPHVVVAVLSFGGLVLSLLGNGYVKDGAHIPREES